MAIALLYVGFLVSFKADTVMCLLFYIIGNFVPYDIKPSGGMRTSRLRKMAADAASLRRKSPASRTLCSHLLRVICRLSEPLPVKNGSFKN